VKWQQLSVSVAQFSKMWRLNVLFNVLSCDPLNLIYAFTAMSEIPLQAAGLVTFAMFVWKAPVCLCLLGGIWRVVAVAMIAADLFAVVRKDDGPLTFLRNELTKLGDGK